MSGTVAPGYALDEIQARAAAARMRSAELAAMANHTAARPEWNFNHVIAYGQSLSSGWEGWPALSVQQRHDSLMIGQSVHGVSEAGPHFEPAGEVAFRPLVATVMSNGSKGEIAGPETVVAFKPGNPALGETVLEGALDYWRGRQRMLRDNAVPAGRFVATSCGVGGRTIEQLSFGKPLFGRPQMAVDVARRLAAEAGGTFGITALLWLQGESNSVGGGTQDRTEYLRLTEALQADFNREIVAGIVGQSRMPAVFTHQVSGLYVRDATDMAIPMAQLDCAYALPDWFMVAPSYPVTEKGGHLDPNGYRWLGQQFGKVMHKVLDLGEGWKPLHPLRATVRGAQVLVDFHVPHPPLVFAPCYRGTTPTSFADGGFSVTDDAGRIGVAAAAVVSETSVLLVLERAPGAGPMLWYADQAPHGGYGNLRDSDPTEASQAYEWQEGSGQYAGARIPDLIGKPYPLWNWCVAFLVPLQVDPLPDIEGMPVGESVGVSNVPDAPDPVMDELRPAEQGTVQPTLDPPPAALAPAPGRASSPAWDVLRGEATPSTPPHPAAEPPAPGGVLGWLQRLFGNR